MKRYLLSFFFALLGLMATAQTHEEHLTFMGIPMTGTLEEFSQKLQEKGMEPEMQKEKYCTFTGTFFGFSDCRILVPRGKNQIVHTAVVNLPYATTWERLDVHYSTLKLSLMKKYGEPFSCVEEFLNGTPSTNPLKMDAVNRDECNYKTLFKTDKGMVILSIAHLSGDGEREGEHRSNVVLIYVDSENYSKENARNLDDL